MGIALTLALGLTGAAAHAQTWKPPADTQRCPSKWGAGDERGSANHVKPESVLKATRLVKIGEVIEIAHVLNDKMAISATRRFDVHTKRTFMNQRVRLRHAAAEGSGLHGRHRGARRPVR
jgi:hypothetical protein